MEKHCHEDLHFKGNCDCRVTTYTRLCLTYLHTASTQPAMLYNRYIASIRIWGCWCLEILGNLLEITKLKSESQDSNSKPTRELIGAPQPCCKPQWILSFVLFLIKPSSEAWKCHSLNSKEEFSLPRMELWKLAQPSLSQGEWKYPDRRGHVSSKATEEVTAIIGTVACWAVEIVAKVSLVLCWVLVYKMLIVFPPSWHYWNNVGPWNVKYWGGSRFSPVTGIMILWHNIKKAFLFIPNLGTKQLNC